VYYDFFSPITYNTNVNAFLFNYYNSQPKFQYYNYNIYTFGANTGQSMSFTPVTGPIYSFGSSSSTGGGATFTYTTSPLYCFTGSTSQPVTTVKSEKPASAKKSGAKSKNTSSESKKELRQSFVQTARKYTGYSERDGSYRKFSDSTEWCADFVTYVIKESYRNAGKRIPEGFGSHRCETLKQWAINNNVFLRTAGKSNKAQIIKEKVNPGDILILRENGASHTGIVSKVNSDGSFCTIEGNVRQGGYDKVAEITHSPDDAQISGFVQLV